jgi:hypothetical protein
MLPAGPRAQNSPASKPAPRILGTEVSSEIWYQRSTDTTVSGETALFGSEPFHVTFTITYRGMRLLAAPTTIDLVLARDSGDAAPEGDTASPAVVVIDGLKMPLLRQTRPTPDTIQATIAFEDFQWMVGGKALEFEAFGHLLVLVPSQVISLHTVALEWARLKR